MNGVKILIVEDEAIVAVNVKSILAEFGYETVGISVTADDAVKMAEELKPDIILMDIKLRGEKTGVDAAREIRKKSDITIIFLTAYSDIELLKNAEDTGPVAYMVKPLQKNKLEICLRLSVLRKLQERQLEEKIKELEKETDAAKRAELEEEVRRMKDHVEKQKKELMLLINK